MSLENRLLSAVRKRNLELTKQLIAEGVNVNITEGAENSKTALHRATRNNDIAIVRQLLDAGANPNTLDRRNCSPLRTAIDFGPFELVTLLLRRGSKIHPLDFHAAVKNQRKDVVELLLKQGADPFARRSCCGNILCLAAESRNASVDGGDQSYVDILRLLLTHGSKSLDTKRTSRSKLLNTKRTSRSKSEKSALKGCFPDWYVARFNPAEGEFDYNIQRSSPSSMRPRSSKKKTTPKVEPLEAVLEKGSVEALCLFLEYGFELNKRRGLLPIHCAARNRDENVLEFLLKRGGLNIEEDDPKGRTALHVAAQCRKSKNISILLQFGANVDSPDYEGNTPLIIAVEKKDLDSVELLLNSGANVNHSNRIDETPWYIAFTARQIACVELLVARGADFKLRRWCHSHDLLDQANFEIVEPLIRHLALFVSQLRFKNLDNYYCLMNEYDEEHNDKPGSKYLDDCEIELANLETTTIYGSFTFYDFLTTEKICPSQITNQRTVDMFELERLKNMFPIYGVQIYQTFTKVRQSMILRRKAMRGLGKLLTFDVRGFHDIGDRILNCLHDRDLQSLGEV